DAFRLTRFTWVGHSFGARVGLSLAARPASAVESPVERLFIIAGAGVARPRPVSHRLRGKINGWRFRMRKAMARNEAELIALERRFGSADYVQSRALGLRDIFVKIVGEDQSDALPRITAPTTLIYGGRDTETPPELGRRMQALIPGARYVECPEFDHLSILSRGRHQIATLISEQI
ncbi:MAG: alpha/beta fold hydrolase, partial [Pseudomonadota bacterium]